MKSDRENWNLDKEKKLEDLKTKIEAKGAEAKDEGAPGLASILADGLNRQVIATVAGRLTKVDPPSRDDGNK